MDKQNDAMKHKNRWIEDFEKTFKTNQKYCRADWEREREELPEWETRKSTTKQIEELQVTCFVGVFFSFAS